MTIDAKILAIVIIAIILVGVGYYAYTSNTHEEEKTGILIITTFPSLSGDVMKLACDNETVVSIVPPGIDPHEYQLSPKDVNRLKKADLIISTGHAPFEAEIKRLIEDGEIKADIIEIPSINGLRIRENPVTGKPNYHMPIMDPYNYKLFLKTVYEELNKIDPKCKEVRQKKYSEIIETLDGLLSKYGNRYNVDVIASDPTVQYSVEWMGLRVKYLILVEHGTSISSEELKKITQAIMNHEVDCIILSSSVSTQLERFIADLNKPALDINVISIPSPISEGGILEKIINTTTVVSECLTRE